ncbi:hypothetical protein AWENTII_012435 [Aspergillus wentii]
MPISITKLYELGCISGAQLRRCQACGGGLQRSASPNTNDMQAVELYVESGPYGEKHVLHESYHLIRLPSSYRRAIDRYIDGVRSSSAGVEHMASPGTDDLEDSLAG